MHALLTDNRLIVVALRNRRSLAIDRVTLAVFVACATALIASL